MNPVVAKTSELARRKPLTHMVFATVPVEKDVFNAITG